MSILLNYLKYSPVKQKLQYIRKYTPVLLYYYNNDWKFLRH